MKAMTNEGAREWCSRAGLKIAGGDTLRHKRPREHLFFITSPEEHRLIVALARNLICLPQGGSFAGGLVWLRRWNIGSPELVRPGWRILEDMRRAHGEHRSLEVAPSQSFRDDEFVELHAFLIQVIAYGWVTDFVPSTGGYFFHFKDNRQICGIAQSLETSTGLRAALRRWNPTDEDPMVARPASMKKLRRARGVAGRGKSPV